VTEELRNVERKLFSREEEKAFNFSTKEPLERRELKDEI